MSSHRMSVSASAKLMIPTSPHRSPCVRTPNDAFGTSASSTAQRDTASIASCCRASRSRSSSRTPPLVPSNLTRVCHGRRAPAEHRLVLRKRRAYQDRCIADECRDLRVQPSLPSRKGNEYHTNTNINTEKCSLWQKCVRTSSNFFSSQYESATLTSGMATKISNTFSRMRIFKHLVYRSMLCWYSPILYAWWAKFDRLIDFLMRA